MYFNIGDMILKAKKFIITLVLFDIYTSLPML